jgi:SAM-dependent methyltransferase
MRWTARESEQMFRIARWLKLLPKTISYEALLEHYEFEKELAARLREAPYGQRAPLYPVVYDELFRRVPHLAELAVYHEESTVRDALRVLRPYLTPTTRYLEVGAGRCALALEVAKQVERVVAVDVAADVAPKGPTPANFSFVLSDGASLGVLPNSVDVVFSDQLMEHLHPEDAIEQLRQIERALTPGGIYCCVTPNRLSGPWDISFCFDREATGLHLHEYSVTELAELFQRMGLVEPRCIAVAGRWHRELPVGMVTAVEGVISRFEPTFTRRKLLFATGLAAILSMPVIARKRAVQGSPQRSTAA